ncbi:CHAT domain-containing protein, partial [Actinoallomurus bryophytorum]
RAGAIAGRPPAIRPPRDRRLAGLLAELRRVSAEVSVRPELLAAQTRLEQAVRTRTRVLTSSRDTVRGWAWLVPALFEALADRMFVELIRDGDDLLAVTVAGGRCRRVSLGPYARAEHDVRLLRFAVSRLAHAATPATPAAAQGLACAAGRLDARLCGPLRLGDRPVVLAPTGALHGLPWAALPSLAGRPLTVVPSVASWLRTLRVPDAPGHVTLVAGPDLAHAAGEVTAVRSRHPSAVLLTGAAATSDAVRAALDGAATAHLAVHGRFRSGNALFSSLRLADGPLITYDLERLTRPPRLLVLSACDAGRADVRAGEAVMGMAASLLSFGTATVVAAVTPVGDTATPGLMTGFHERLATGMSPAEALAATPRDPATLGFLCFGAGYERRRRWEPDRPVPYERDRPDLHPQ